MTTWKSDNQHIKKHEFKNQQGKTLTISPSNSPVFISRNSIIQALNNISKNFPRLERKWIKIQQKD